MFKIDECILNTTYAIRDGKNCLHSDGTIYQTGEYFPSIQIAQAVLDKFYPEPEHEWENGDVFVHGETGTMIYLKSNLEPAQVFYLYGVNIGCAATCPANSYLNGAKFLFNIREKL